MAGAAPQKFKKILSCAKKKDWDSVFRGLGCVLDLKNRHAAQNASWEELLQTFKSDFWGKNVPLAKERRNWFKPLTSTELISENVFRSLQINLIISEVKLSEEEELQVVTLALKEDDWAAITAIFFFFCGRRCVSKALAEATRKAVQTRDWRFVDGVAVDFMKYHVVSSQELLKILGLWDVLDHKERRTAAVRDLLGNEDWDTVVLEICQKALAISCLESYEKSNEMKSWTTAIDFMEEFQCETDVNMEYMLKCMQYSVVDRDHAEELITMALAKKKSYLLRSLGDELSLSHEQASKALILAHAACDFPTLSRCLRLYDSDNSHLIEGKPVLFSALRLNKFQLSKDLLPADINAPHQGYILLHTAVDRWQEDSSGNIVLNIMCLMENNADINIKDPAGRTVLQKLADKSKDKPNQPDTQRTQLIASGASSAAEMDREVDWTHVPDSEWNALHVLCDEGDFDCIPRLIELKANPFEHRQGLTLFDTAILSPNHNLATKLRLCRILVKIRGLVIDHVETVLSRSRPVIEETQYQFPLLYLLQLMQSHKTYFKLIKSLNEHKVFAEVEYHQAIKEPMMSSLREFGLEDVISFLEKNAVVCKPGQKNKENKN